LEACGITSARGENLEVKFTGGVLYRIDPDGAVSERKRGLGITNTLAWSPDYRTFYFADSTANAIYSCVYDERIGAISGEKAFIVDFLQGHPDGSAIDAQGYIWNARNGGGCFDQGGSRRPR
jgi:sugar lactone lactonase YvrE